MKIPSVGGMPGRAELALIAFGGAIYFKLLYWFFFQTRFPYEGWDFLIPTTALVIAYLQWKKNSNKKYSGSLRFAGVSALAVLVYFLFPNHHTIQTLSFMLYLIGMCLALGGHELLKVYIFPISLLFLKLPIGGYLLQVFGYEAINHIQAVIIAKCSSFLGITSTVMGTEVQGPSFKTLIIDHCSGWYTLDAKLFIGILFIYFSSGSLKTKWIKSLFVFPIITLLNFLRIFLLHIAWNIPTGINPDLLHTYSNHLHKIVLLIVLYILAFGFPIVQKRPINQKK